MILTQDNLQEWKNQLDIDASRITKSFWDLSQSLSDEEWLRNYIDMDTEDVVRDEISYEI
jgi:acyl carrier protein phosphodiesterase